MTARPPQLPSEGLDDPSVSRLPESLSALGSAEYRWFAAGALISGVGVWAVRAAQVFMVLAATRGSGLAAGALAALQYFPLMVLGGAVGVLADRRPKARVLAAGVVFMAVSAALEGLLASRAQIGTSIELLLALVFGMGSAVDNSLRIAVAPELVPEASIANAVSLNFVLLQVARLAGPAVAGVGMAVWGPTPVFMGAAATMLLYVVVLLRLHAPFASSRRSEDGSARAGLAYVRQRPDLVLIFAMVGLGGLIGPNLGTMAAVVVEVGYAGNTAQAGFVTSVLATGTLLGAVWTTRHPARAVSAVARATALLGMTSIVASLAPSVASFALLLMPTGFAALVMVSQAGSLIQTAVDPAFRGRVTSLYAIVILVGVPIGSPVYGALTAMIGPRLSLAAMGSLLVLATLLAAAAYRRIATTTDGPAVEVVD